MCSPSLEFKTAELTVSCLFLQDCGSECGAGAGITGELVRTANSQGPQSPQAYASGSSEMGPRSWALTSPPSGSDACSGLGTTGLKETKPIQGHLGSIVALSLAPYSHCLLCEH